MDYLTYMLNPLIDITVADYESTFDMVKMHWLVCAKILSRQTCQYRDALDIIVASELKRRQDLIDEKMKARGFTVPDILKMQEDGNYHIKQLAKEILKSQSHSDIQSYLNAVNPILDKWSNINESGRSDIVWNSRGASTGQLSSERLCLINKFIITAAPYMTIRLKHRDKQCDGSHDTTRVKKTVKRVKNTNTVANNDTSRSTLRRIFNRMQGKSGFVPSPDMLERLRPLLGDKFKSIAHTSSIIYNSSDASKREEVWAIAHAIWETPFVNFEGRESEIAERYEMVMQLLKEKKEELNLTNIPVQYRIYMICRDLGLKIPRDMFDFPDEKTRMVTTWVNIKHYFKW